MFHRLKLTCCLKVSGWAGVVLAGSLLGSGEAVAHHGQDFLLLQDAFVPEPWHGSMFGSYEWSRVSNRNGYGLETGLMLGVAPHVALGASVEFSDSGGGWHYDSVAPFLHINLIPPEWRVQVALQAGYAFVEEDEPAPALRRSSKRASSSPARKESTSEPTSPELTDPVPPQDPGDYNPDDPGTYNPDAPRRTPRHAGHAPAPSSPSSSSSLDRSSDDREVDATATGTALSAYRGLYPSQNHWFGRLIIEADVTQQDKFLFNLLWVSPQHGPPAWGYAAGWQHRFSHEWAVGLEAIGDFGMEDEHEMVAGVYWSPWHHGTFKLGLGWGLTEESPDFSVRAGLVWRF